MSAALPIIVGVVGSLFTVYAAWRAWSIHRSGGPREMVTGWIVLMLVGAMATVFVQQLL
jgi:hypothetical protein